MAEEEPRPLYLGRLRFSCKCRQEGGDLFYIESDTEWSCYGCGTKYRRTK